ncbi:radical SAM protein [Tepiditoga spiralis]|uniref:Radical SAM protein n=1 Tax=Tepiditoga spiralis TaxID=2108365 RepID=A0A7G1G5S2_9BACT|nr:radical SAM protein [Tepiditoga spiralis]BBE31938.1 radical SAM protein [Tepiditoga spiralis]
MSLMDSMKNMMMKQVSKLVTNVVRKSDVEQLAKLFWTLSKFTKEPTKSGIVKLAKGAENHDPMLVNWAELFKKSSPKQVEKIINNLIINEFAIGEKVRQEKMHEHKVVLPKLAIISPTYACNLRCVGCYSALYGHKYQLSKDELFDTIRQFNDLGIYFFIITGGEPFVYPHLFEMLEEFDDSFFMIYTNSTLINEEKAKRLSELGNATLAISVEGFEEMTDWRRGKGVFKQIQNAWNLLTKYGVVYGASVTATSKNHDLIISDEFWDFLKDNGNAFSWVFQFMPVGKDATMDLVPSAEQRLERFRKLEELRLGGKFAFVADFWNHGFLTHGCLAAGSKYLHINAKGFAEPCVFQQFAVDNIRDKTVLEILKSPFFEAYKRTIPYSDNLFRPCPIIDNPKVFRSMVNKFNAIPQHPGSERTITDLAPELDKLAADWKVYADKLWIDEGYSEKWPSKRGVYNYETRMRRYENHEEKLALDKK